MHYNGHMERSGGEQTERDLIYESLSNVTEYEMLQIRPEGIRLMVYVDSGEYEDRIVRYGDADVTIRSPKQIPAVLYEGQSITDLIAYYDTEDDESDAEDDELYEQPDYSIDSDEYREWVSSLVTREDLQLAVLNRAMASDREADHETLTCVACGGKQKIAQECWCLYHEQRYGEDDEWKPQSANPSCGTCGGSGAVENACDRCDGIGVIAKHPFIQFFDEATGDTKRITLDLTQLVASGDVELVEHNTEYRSLETDSEFAYRRIAFDLQSYIQRKVTEFGFDPESVGIVTEEGLLGLPGAERINVDGGHATWRKKNGQLKKKRFDDYESLTPDEIIESAQQALARQFAYRLDRLKNDSGLVGGEEWILRKFPPFEQSFELFKQKLFRTVYKGGYCTLGFTQFDPERGAPEPAFYVLDQDGNRLFRISGDENIHASLESARAMFEALLIFEDELRTSN